MLPRTTAFALLVSLSAVACAASEPAPPALAPLPPPVTTPVTVVPVVPTVPGALDRSRSHGPLGEAGQRLLPLRERRLVRDGGDPGGSQQHGRGRAADRGAGEAHLGAARRGLARRLARDQEGGRLLRGVHGRGRHRVAGPQAAQADARSRRSHPRRTQPRDGARERAPRRRRSAEQHEPPHGSRPRPLGRAGPRRSLAVRALSPARRARDARPGVLPRRRAADGGAAHEVPGARRRDVEARRHRRARCEGGAHRGARAQDRRDARHARGGRGREEGEQPVAPQGVRDARSRHELGRVLRGGGARDAANVHRVAAGRGDGAGEAREARAARALEGVPDAARAIEHAADVLPKALSDEALRVLRDGARRCRGFSLPAGSEPCARPMPRWATPWASCTSRKYFPPGGRAGRGEDGRRHRGGVRPAHRLARVDGARHEGEGPGEALDLPRRCRLPGPLEGRLQGSPSRETRRSATSSARNARSTTTASRSSASPWTAASGPWSRRWSTP